VALCSGFWWRGGGRKAQSYRVAYLDPEYARNRARRRVMAAGRRESCGTPLVGVGERHHVIAVRGWQGPGSLHQVQNLRILCHDCHKAKTRGARRARRASSG